ncbi:hypothetical protein LTS18_009803 [Coniosporium uncinatum]|uniref:Uncharacterized protein n=1 Tax=Coniosporium uncinatum TaxID=93489 RepID=A0ACC3DLP5_9PEZI|nr:hypothetical protein LTS18_009803 [Coniosporium uncinatum]
MKASEAFREFLTNFYSRKYRAWPPSSKSDIRWLSRDIVHGLQRDFGAIYDYLVDRDIVWDPTEERHTRKWEMICTKHRPDSAFNADAHGIPLTDMLVSFDYKHNYKHIPHPFPLLPWSPKQSPRRVTEETKKSKPSSFLSNLKRSKPAPAAAAPAKDPKEQHQLSLALNGATNINKLDGSPVLDLENPILDALVEHEKALHLSASSSSSSSSSSISSNLSPAEARLGRWVLLYGILQTLSTVSVDVEGLRYTEGCAYMLSCGLEGCPPWRVPGRDAEGVEWARHGFGEAGQERSYCWVTPLRWGGGGRGSGGEVVGGGGSARAGHQGTETSQHRPRPRRTQLQAPRMIPDRCSGYAASIQRHGYHYGYATNTRPDGAPVVTPGFAPEDLVDEVSELDGRSIIRVGGDVASPTSLAFSSQQQQQYKALDLGKDEEEKEKGYFYGQSPNIVMFPPSPPPPPPPPPPAEEKTLGKGDGVLRPDVPTRSARREGMIDIRNGSGLGDGQVSGVEEYGCERINVRCRSRWERIERGN